MGKRGLQVGRWGAVLLLFGGSLVATPDPSVYGEINLTEKLMIHSDFRYRYEIDDGSDKTQLRDRQRFRFRLGFVYKHSEWTQFGMRLRAKANSAQSPHQNLGDLNEDFVNPPTQKTSPDFGLDRAYIKFRWLDHGFLWLGKNQAAIWQQAENFWDVDFQAEGVAVGYRYPLGGKSHLMAQGSYSLLVEDNFIGAFQDRAIVPIQGIYERDFGGAVLTLGVAGAPTIISGGKSLPGGERTYYLFNVQAQVKALPIPVQLGYEAYYGTGSRVGHLVVTRVLPWKKLEFRFFWNYIPVNSVPLQGAIVMDDSRFSSNYEGFQIGLWYTISPKLQIDFRVLPQDTLDENLNPALVPGLGNYVMQSGNSTRYQTNLNIRF